MNYTQMLAGLVIIGSHSIFGGKEGSVSQGTHLTSLRESDEYRVSGSLQLDEFVLPDVFNVQGRSSYSSSKTKSQLSLLHASEEYQIVAAWIQLSWIPEDTGSLSRKNLFSRMHDSERWKSRGERVKRIIAMLEQATVGEKSIFEIYEACFQKTEHKDRCVPGCGNNRRALINPERFMQRMGFSKISS